MRGLIFGFGQMLLQELAHAEGLDPLVPEDGLHGLVRGEELLVVGILEVLLLQVGPEPFDDLTNWVEMRFDWPICRTFNRNT